MLHEADLVTVTLLITPPLPSRRSPTIEGPIGQSEGPGGASPAVVLELDIRYEKVINHHGDILAGQQDERRRAIGLTVALSMGPYQSNTGPHARPEPMRAISRSRLAWAVCQT